MGLWIVFRPILASDVYLQLKLSTNYLQKMACLPICGDLNLGLELFHEMFKACSLVPYVPVLQFISDQSYQLDERKVECSRYEVRAQATLLLIALKIIYLTNLTKGSKVDHCVYTHCNRNT